MKNQNTPEKGTPILDSQKFRVEITDDGPYIVHGVLPIHTYTITNDENGNSWDYDIGKQDFGDQSGVVHLCRCGHSKAAPYCDGSHLTADWNSQLTAPLEPPLDRAELIEGGTLVLTDVEELCAFARFCDAKGRTWNQIEASDDPEQRALAIRTSMACPAGRLKAWDKESGEPFEPDYKPQIGLIEDPTIRVSGPIFLMGGIPVFSSEGEGYTPRNRQTLCRCGESRNKPFCDGTHSPAHYHDDIPLKASEPDRESKG